MENKKIKVLALFGKNASGKSSIKRWLAKNYDNINEIVSYTTRPPREGEVNGKDYYFIDMHFFALKDMIEYQNFRGWWYGTSYHSLDKDKINVSIFSIARLKQILNIPQLEVLPVYIQSPDRFRLLRSLNREGSVDCKEICRRFLADEEDFKEIDFEYEVYENVNKFEDFKILNIPKVKEFIGQI